MQFMLSVSSICSKKRLSRHRLAFADPSSAAQYTTDFVYDELCRLIQANTVYEGESVSTVYTYDAVGNRKTVRDGKNNLTEYFYDTANRIYIIRYMDNTGIEFRYDHAGNHADACKRS